MEKIIFRGTDPDLILVDLFCGAGGTTTGFSMAEIDGRKLVEVIACVNHDPKQIKSHWLNHPHVTHYEEDIRTLDLTELTELVQLARGVYPNAKLLLWASLECTNFSRAKGGQPRDGDSRTLADHLPRYITAIAPDYVQIENVVEFMSWGPLDENGKPISSRNGADFKRWCGEIDELGYFNEWRELNSADFGAYTSRNRLFGCFAKYDLPIVWPEPTHIKVKGKRLKDKGVVNPDLLPWKPVKDVLDFEDKGNSIFGRSKPLSDKTLARIYAGLVKYVAGGKDAFMLKFNSMDKNGNHTPPSVDEPCPVIAAQNRLGMCFITQRNGGEPSARACSVDEPARTLTATGGNLDMVNTDVSDQCFLQKWYGNGDEALPGAWIDRNFSGGGQHSSIETVAGTILAERPKLNLVQCDPFIMQTNYTNVGSSIEDPAPPLLASRRHHYIINPSHGGHCSSVDAPCPVIVARQDKAPLYLAGVLSGMMSDNVLDFLSEADICLFIDLYFTDTPSVKRDDQDLSIQFKIVEFMLLYGIRDILMRMLKVMELKKIQGFPVDYQLAGNQTDQKKGIGNSVAPAVPKAMAEAYGREFLKDNAIAA